MAHTPAHLPIVTFVWSFQAFGASWDVLQEYTMFLTVPASLLGFLLGLALDRSRRT